MEKYCIEWSPKRYAICDVFLWYFIFFLRFPLSIAEIGKETDGNEEEEEEIMELIFELMIIISCQITVIEDFNHKTRFRMSHVRSFALDIEFEHFEIIQQSNFLIAAGDFRVFEMNREREREKFQWTTHLNYYYS